MIKLIVILIVIILIAAFFFYINGYEGNGIQKPVATPKKPVILLVIDSLMDQSLQKAIQADQTPTLAYLKQHGHYFPHVISAYPTMSVSIDSTLMTGTYPDQHHLPGLVWYDQSENRFVNYGSGRAEITALGLGQVLTDGVMNLNNQHLSKDVQTIHEKLYKMDIDSASINALIYRGNHPHNLSIPRLGSLLKLLPKDVETFGPSLLSLGRLSQLNPDNKHQNRFWQGFGFNDTFTANELIYLIENDQLPAFSVAYFPDPDHTVHKNGPMDSKGITKTDAQLKRIFNMFGSMEEAFEKATWIIMGDSGQSAIGDDKQKALIDLQQLFSDYKLALPNRAIEKNDQLLLAVNERMAYIYLLDRSLGFKDISHLLEKDERIGFIAWKENSEIVVKRPDQSGTLKIKKDGEYEDEFGQSWTIDGDPSLLDAAVEAESVQFGQYPDAFSRLYGALFSHEGRFLIVDAKPGHEFSSEKTPTHIGGAGHGSLHILDSTAPMVIAGTDETPDTLRHVDLKRYFLKLIKNNN